MREKSRFPFMKNSRYKMIAALIALVLLLGAWVFWGAFGRQEKLAGADRSIESGIALFEQMKYQEALDIFERIPPGSPREWNARYYQGSTYIMLKDYPSAVTYLEQALALNPEDTKILHALGVCYYKMGNLKLAKAYYTAILEIDPDDGEAKGLMDIMAKLERDQTESSAKKSEKTDDTGEEHH